MQDSKLPKRQYTDEFKVEVTGLAESVGEHEANRRLGVSVVTLGNWKWRSVAAGTAATKHGAVQCKAAILARVRLGLLTFPYAFHHRHLCWCFSAYRPVGVFCPGAAFRHCGGVVAVWGIGIFLWLLDACFYPAAAGFGGL